MKNFILFVAIAVGLASCAKDPIKETNETLDGSWNLTSYTIDGEEALGANNLVESATYTFAMDEDATGKLTVKLKAFGQEQSAESTYVISGDDGEVITITDSDGEKTEGTVSFDGDSMTMKYDNSEGKPEVIKADKQ